MKRADIHLSDEELLRFADGELSLREIAGVNRHLASCWECRSRAREMDETIAGFVGVHRRTLDPRLPPANGPRALLKVRLAESARDSRQGSLLQSLQGAFSWRTVAYAGMALAIGILAASIAYRPAHSYNSGLIRLEPDHALTPGDARTISTSDVCRVSHSDDARLLSASTQQKVLQEYGIDRAQSQEYELDYLISPQLGGTDDIRNLWPEPESSTAWNVQAKDALEMRLRQLVCDGTINLATAQRDLATDWVSAYKRYFHTDRPL